MTAEHATERALRVLLQDDINVLPDRVLDAIVAELPLRRQHRRWWSRPGAQARAAIAIAAVAIAVTAGVGFALRPGGVAAPIPTQSPTPTASPTPTPSPTVRPGYGTEPPGFPTPAPFGAATPLPDPSGDPLPADLVGREYNSNPLETQGPQALVLTLRGPDDPHCVALYHGSRSTCFTIIWRPGYPKHVGDPGARGSARIVDGNLVLGFDVVIFDKSCEGTTSTYAISADRSTLTAVDVPPCSFRGFTAH
jgi:hypothetical protein